jgi:hypothetical protein
MARNAAQISVYDGVSRQGFSTPARECLKKMTPLGKSTLVQVRFNRSIDLAVEFPDDNRIDNPILRRWP